MPTGSKIDRAHTAIARSIGGKNASGRAWAVMQSRGMVKRRGSRMVMTPRFRRGHALPRSGTRRRRH